jgi:hypothetical protein
MDGAIVADFITTGTLDASKITVTNLDAGSITTGTLDASNITVTNLNAQSITTGYLNIARIQDGSITGGENGKIAQRTIIGGSSGNIAELGIKTYNLDNSSVTYPKAAFQATLDQVGINTSDIRALQNGEFDSLSANFIGTQYMYISGKILSLSTISIGGTNRNIVTWSNP